MKNIMLLSVTAIALCMALLISCKKDDELPAGTIQLTFDHIVGEQGLVLGDKEYTNTAGNSFRVEKLKYYISNIKLNRKDGSFFSLPDNYFLIEESNISQRRQIELTGIPAGSFTSITFAVGVDSARNFSTELVGDLNPNNDMAWNWVSGYKFFLMEGKYTTNDQVTDALIYHIGGNTSYRNILPKSHVGSFAVRGNRTTEIIIQANVNRVFDTASIIDLNDIHAVMEPGQHADKIANNYAAGMFNIQQIITK